MSKFIEIIKVKDERKWFLPQLVALMGLAECKPMVETNSFLLYKFENTFHYEVEENFLVFSTNKWRDMLFMDIKLDGFSVSREYFNLNGVNIEVVAQIFLSRVCCELIRQDSYLASYCKKLQPYKG